MNSIADVFKAALLGLHLGELFIVLTRILLVLAIAVPALGEDRPQSYFRKDAPAAAKSLLLTTVAQGAVKPRAKGPSEVPKSYFRKDEPSVAPVPLLIDDLDEKEPESTDVTIFTPITDPEDIGEPIPPAKPSAHVGLTAMISRAMTIYDDLPPELGDDGRPESKLTLPVYMPDWCVVCWAGPGIVNPRCPVNQLKDDSRFDLKIIVGELPPEKKDVAYPCVYDEKTGRAFWGRHLASADALLSIVNTRRMEAGVIAGGPLHEDDAPVVGELQTAKLEPFWSLLLAIGDGRTTAQNKPLTFERKAFTLSLPAGLQIQWASDKSGVRLSFPDEKPEVKINGFFHAWHKVQSVSISKKRVLVQCTWHSLWKQFAWEVR